jgi:hypothetical protein
MPIIQRNKVWFESKEFVQTVKVSAAGEFSVALPAPVATMFGYEILRGATKDEVISKWKSHVEDYSKRQSSTKRVILFEVHDRIAFADGLSICITAQEYFETKTIKADGGALFDYDEVNSFNGGTELDHALYPDNRGELKRSGRKEAQNKIDSTPERIAFLNKVAKALTRIKAELDKLQKPEDLARIADAGRFLEDRK